MLKRLGIYIFLLVGPSVCAMHHESKESKANYVQKKAWSYLKSAAFKERLKKAAEFVHDCDTIVEIGGGESCIDGEIKDKNIIVVDPVCRRVEKDKVTHIRSTFQRWDAQVSSPNYAVVLLGLKLEKMDIKDWQKLYDLINRSKKLVLEYSRENAIGLDQAKTIKKNIEKKLIDHEDFDITGTERLGRVYAQRSIMYFQ